VLHVAIDRGGGRRINGAGHGSNAPVMIDGAANDLENAKEIVEIVRECARSGYGHSPSTRGCCNNIKRWLKCSGTCGVVGWLSGLIRWLVG
jgi:hypothetical protein